MKRKLYLQPAIELVEAAPAALFADSMIEDGETDLIPVFDDDELDYDPISQYTPTLELARMACQEPLCKTNPIPCINPNRSLELHDYKMSVKLSNMCHYVTNPRHF